MKKKILIILWTLINFASYSQTELQIIKESNEFIKKKKYESAFAVLDKFDSKNTNPNIFLLKQDLVLNYFIVSMSHKMFSLKDILPSEDVMDYRKKGEGSSNLLTFDIEASLEKLIKENPNNYKLQKSLADYYYDVLLKYGGNWTKSLDDLKDLIKKNYTIAIENGAADYMSYYSLGYLSITQEKYEESIPYFLKSIELKSDYPTSNYNLSIAYLYTSDSKSALKYAIKSYDLYSDLEYKSDAARIASQLYYELDDIDNAIKFIEYAETSSPKNYDNYKHKLKCYLRKDHPKVKEMTYQIFISDPSNPGIYNDLEEIFYQSKNVDKLILFYNTQKENKEYDAKTLGNIHLYLARLYFDKENTLVKQNLLKAKEFFMKVYDKDHEVFEILNKFLSLSEK